MIRSSEVGTLFFWFFFVVTVLWTLVAVIFKAKKLISQRK
ncbi:hypothetical protein SAMN06269117_10447 [Balnearium lithotrophicum]|uniref:Uncharacterized protein n=1 Tax=Balnearium lithotrophicum TaxID=223788 RepID=A0A521B7A5_9BACT|nr:hypothetical protein SAMN06269117_10447 [Balnearium lithotrophicum]